MKSRSGIGPEAAELVAALFAQSEVGLTVVDRELRYTHVNTAFGRFRRQSPAEIVGRTMTDVLGELAPPIEAATQQVLESGEPVIGCEVVVDESGDDGQRWFRVNRYPVPDTDGGVAGVVSIIVEVTDLKRTHDRLDAALARERESHQLLDAIFESAPVALAFADRDLRYVRTNRIAAENWGVTPEEMVGRTPEEIIHEDAAAAISRVTRSVLTTGAAVVGQAIQSEVPRGSGRFKHWLSSRYPVCDTDGDIVGVATIAADVTELREAEARLDKALATEREERALLDLLFAKAPSIIAYHDRDLHYVRVNDAFATFYGRRPDEYPGKTLQEMHPDIADRIEAAMREVLETGKPAFAVSQAAYSPGSGQRRNLRVSRYPIKADDGEVIGIGVIADDVTDLVNAEQQIRETLGRERETHALLDAVFGQAPVGISFVDRDMRLVRVNRAFATFRGVAPQEIVGQTLQEAFPELADQIEAATRRVLETGRPVESQLVSGNLRGDARGTRFFSSSRYPVVDSSGAVHGVASIVVDVTDLKQAEELLSRENSRLETEATTDPLTGLPNRRLLEQHAASMVAYARRAGRAVGALYLDLDGFKAVNDTLGHAAGDELLKEVATRTTAVAREGDVVARFGGDEFLVLLPDLRPETAGEVAEGVAERLVEAIGQPVNLGGRSCRIGVSVGVSLFPGDAGDEVTLLERADASMYERKRHDDGSVVSISRGTRRVA